MTHKARVAAGLVLHGRLGSELGLSPSLRRYCRVTTAFTGLCVRRGFDQQWCCVQSMSLRFRDLPKRQQEKCRTNN